MIVDNFKDYPDLRRIKIPLGYYYMGENSECPYCKEEGWIYGTVEPNDSGGYCGEFMCVKCECTWSKL